MCLASLRSTRRVLRLSGSDVFHFLQGLTTNDVLPLAPNASSPTPSLYSAFLTPQGRILSDVFFHRERGGRTEGEPSTSSLSSGAPPSPNALFAEVGASVAPQILSLLRRYRLRAQVDIDDVGEDFEVAVKGFGGMGKADKEGDDEREGWPRDPRGLAALGFRTVVPSGSISQSSISQASSPISYASARYALGVAEGEELEPGRGTPLEANLDGLRGVCFTKGCYVGQELVARAHFRGQVHKRVMPVKILGGDGAGRKEQSGYSSLIGRDVVAAAASDSFAATSASASSSRSAKPPRSAGRLLALCKESGTGLALLRLSAVRGLLLPGKKEREEVRTLVALAPSNGGGGGGGDDDEGSGIVFSPSRPEWWPEDWGRE